MTWHLTAMRTNDALRIYRQADSRAKLKFSFIELMNRSKASVISLLEQSKIESFDTVHQC